MEPNGIRNDPNFAFLADRDEYAKYFNMLGAAFGRVLRSYQGAASQSEETGLVAGFLKKLQFNMEVLRIRWTYGLSNERPLWVDLTDSGFPNSMEINKLAVDLAMKTEMLKSIPAKTLLKMQLLDHLLEKESDSPEIVQRLTERTYFEKLDADNLFLSFTPGELVLKEKTANGQGRRNYLFSWGCYDTATNRPYIHLMTFDQDLDQQPLEEQGQSFEEFLKVVRAEGSRAPDVKILAFAIDDALEPIHPKIVKRLCVGPLYSGLFEGREVDSEDQQQAVFKALLKDYARNENDFVLLMSDEIIFSKAQNVTRRLLSTKVREIFAIMEEDPQCFRRGASVVHHTMLLPHYLLQHIGQKVGRMLPDLQKFVAITYDDKGGIRNHGSIKS